MIAAVLRHLMKSSSDTLTVATIEDGLRAGESPDAIATSAVEGDPRKILWFLAFMFIVALPGVIVLIHHARMGTAGTVAELCCWAIVTWLVPMTGDRDPSSEEVARRREIIEAAGKPA